MGAVYSFRVWVRSNVETFHAWIDRSPYVKLLVYAAAVFAFGYQVVNTLWLEPGNVALEKLERAKLEGRFETPRVEIGLNPTQCTLRNADVREVKHAAIWFNEGVIGLESCGGAQLTGSSVEPADSAETLAPGARLSASVPKMQLLGEPAIANHCDSPRACVNVIECQARFFRAGDLQGFTVTDFLFVGSAGNVTRSEIQSRRWNEETNEMEVDGWTTPQWKEAVECYRTARERNARDLAGLRKGLGTPSPVPFD